MHNRFITKNFKKYSFILLILIPLSVLPQNSLKQLEESPRHQEWISLSVGEMKLKSFLVFPEVAEKVPVVILIHENRGLNDWARSMADQISAMGYIVLAPDLLSGLGPKGGGTSSFEDSDTARTAVYNLVDEQITNNLKATFEYGRQIPSANGKVSIIGFCWGGSQSFRFASNENGLEAVFVCYGSGPKELKAYESIQTPVYGFYGEKDNRVNATINFSKKAMQVLGKKYQPIIYDGAGHGFFRSGEGENASEANKKARKYGLKRLQELLSKN